MPIYTLPNGKRYNIPENKVNTFLNKFPSAIIEQEAKMPPTVPGAIVGSDVAPANMDLTLGDSSLDSLGNLNNKLLDLSVSYNIPEKKDISFSESVANSLNNMVERIKQISPKINLTSGMIYRKIFGDENVNKFVEYAGDDSFWTEGLSEQDKIEAIQKIQESQAKSKETGEIIEGFKEGDVSDIVGGIFNAATSFVPSLLEGGAGFLLGGKVGAGLMIGTDFFGDSYISINEEKAKRLNIPLEDLINSGKDEVLTPLIFSSAMAAAESFGLGKVANVASKQLSGAVMRKLSNFILAGAAESGTEIFQTALEKAQQTYGKSDDIGKTAARFAEAFTEQDTWEAGVQGFIGGAGFSGLGNKDVRNAISLGRAPEDIKGIEADIDELSNLNTKLRGVNDNTAKKGIENKISEVQERLKNRIIKGNAIFDFASDKDINEINNLDDLAKLQVKRFNDLKEKRNKNKITQEEYSIATEGYKAEYIKAKNRIQGVKENLQDKSNKQAQQVNKLYEEKGKEGIAEILELYRPMAKRIASKYRNVPGFEMEIMTDEILTGERGILDLINSYKPDTKVPLSAYVNKFAATRGIEAAKRNLKESFELDVTEAKGVTDTTTAETQVEIQEQAKAEIKTELAKDLNLAEDTQNEVVTAVEKTLGTKLPAVTDTKFKAALTKGLRTELTNTFKKVFGRTAAYEQFLRDNFEKIYPAIPQETINKKFKEFNEPVLDKEGKQLRERTAEGKKVFKKKDISKAEFIKYFLNAPGNVKGARKTSLAEVMADEIGLDNVLTSLSKPEIVEKFKAIQEIQGQEVPSNFRAIIAKAINRIDAFIEALDNFEKDKSILKSDFGLTVPAIKIIKLFLKAFKAGLKSGLTIEKAFSKALRKLRKSAEKENLPPQESQIIEDIIEQTPVENFVSLEADQLLNKFNNEYGGKIKQAQLKSIEDFLIPFLKNKIKNVSNEEKQILAQEFYNNWKRVLGKSSLKLNQEDFIKLTKSIFGKNIKINTKQLVDQTQTKRFTNYFIKDENNFKIKQHAQADNNFNSLVKLLKDLKQEYTNDPSSIDNIYFLLSAAGLDMNSIGKSWQRLGDNPDRTELAKKNPETTLEHNPPYDWTLKNIFLPYVVNDIKSDVDLINILKTHKIELISKEAAKKLNDSNGLDLQIKMPAGYKITDDPLIRIQKAYPNLNKAKEESKKSLNRQFNKEILQKSKGVEWTKKFSPVEAQIAGKGKGKFKFFIPYSADDFVGLIYATLGKGKTGDQQMEWYKENLLRPFSRGIQQYEAAKQSALREWTAIKKEAKKSVPGGLDKKNDTGLTNQDAVRIYIWKKQNMEIPGTKESPGLIQENLKIVNANKELKSFADRLIALNPEGYPEPSKNWNSGDITTDLVSYIDGVKRSEFLTEFKDNAAEIFSDANKEKLRALYGDNYIEALDDMLHRMKTGTNRRFGASRIEKQFMDWTNNSVGAIMFFNARSAVLQTLSAVNFVNFSDNNPINAGIAFANQSQYWKDFSTLFNSNFLKQRRTGLQTDVNADEIARAAKGSKNTARAALSAILKFGFTPTQIADSFAIASGGATFYRNRINKYKKEGLSQQEAETKAFTDFQEIAEETQQSARPDRISLQQASSLGRLILAFGNTPMQYARLTKKASLDLINGRGDWKTNISKIMYYSVIQNIIFSALQQGLFALLFDDEDDDKEKSRLFRIGNSSLDTFLRGSGVYGAAAATAKNMILKIIEESEKSRPDYTKVAIESTALSPPINSKLRKLVSAGKTFTYKQSKEKVFTEGFSLENPAFLAGGQVLSALTNLPADRVVLKADHLKTAIEPETELWQSLALSLGWSEWDLNMIQNQTKKSKKFNPRDTNRNINRGLKRKKIKR